ncbi:MAG: site-specific DNA-methyltransferase [Chitinivibrionales bacterium]|nr:site-specific DNA-methyltransferase [Chitinivibrionales bacterium]MBD3355830.1 site-specific DNA-methyltransferase [Chitinivibrionales bacterium]
MPFQGLTTTHIVKNANALTLAQLPDKAVRLVVTSPPYPMIPMWDKVFSERNYQVEKALSAGEGLSAFELMHVELDKVWNEVYRVLDDGGFACINIGDAVRTVNGCFRLYANHARLLSACVSIGFDVLPTILWRKPTNAPNKFMGSGMLPAGAYVTLEHEYILVLRKGSKRVFRTVEERNRRRMSAVFWEERNKWYSDVWTIPATRQVLLDTGMVRRSAAFPLELAYRLVCMYSVVGDTVLDPFLGTGTTSLACAAAGRHSLGVECDREFAEFALKRIAEVASPAQERARRRLEEHEAFLTEYRLKGKVPGYWNRPHGTKVVTGQETDLTVLCVDSIRKTEDGQAAVHRQAL